MRPNTDPQTGVSYGVIHGNDIPELLDLIQSNGDNLSRQNRDTQLASRLKDAVVGALDGRDDAAELADALDYSELVDDLSDAGWDEGGDEDCYQWQTSRWGGPMTLELTYLGGSPLITVILSPWLMRCRPCSPCLPGAGDLNTPDPDGQEAYCLAEEWLPDELRGKSPVYPVGAEPSPTEPVNAIG